MSDKEVIVVELSRIGPEGLEIDVPLDPAALHIEDEGSFSLCPGGRLRCRLDLGEDDAVHVRGHLSARLGLECGRCLTSFELPLEQELDLFYLPHRPDQGEEEEDEVELADRDMVVAYYEGSRLNLGEIVREQVFLSVPLKRLCRESCLGLCRTCGADRNRVACGCPETVEVDPRLRPLKDLFEKGSS